MYALIEYKGKQYKAEKDALIQVDKIDAEKGQTIDIDGLIMNVTGGRGIAIKDEYISSPQLVTLNLKNAEFNTKEKAAIMVTSTIGATIHLENVDIANALADTVNHVWDYASNRIDF